MKYEHKRWLEEHKHDIIAYIIITSMFVGFIIYLIIAYLNGWDLYWG